MASLDDLITAGIPPDVARYMAATPSMPDSGSPAHQPFWQPNYWPTPYQGQNADSQQQNLPPPQQALLDQLGRHNLDQLSNYPQSEGETYGRTPLPRGLLGWQAAGPPSAAWDRPAANAQPSLYHQLIRHLGIAP